jgi:phosphinothricin acetyltransferase
MVARMSVTIRLARPDDAAGVLAIYGPYCDSTTVSFEVAAPTTEQMSQRIERIMMQYPWLIGEADGEVAGYVYASQHRERAAYRWMVDVAVYVAPSHRQRNLGKALYWALFGILRAQGYFKAFAGITLPNAASVRLHESIGFKPIAVYKGVGYKQGRWLDVGWWQLDLQPEIVDPPAPRKFLEIPGSATTAMMREAERLIQAKSPGQLTS